MIIKWCKQCEDFTARYVNGRCRPCTKRHQSTERAMQLRRRRSNARNHNRQLERAERPRPAFCELCGRAPNKGVLCVDHCHETGIFRGWLCSPCNRSIGQLGDNLEGLARAAAYLQTAYSAAPPKAM